MPLDREKRWHGNVCGYYLVTRNGRGQRAPNKVYAAKQPWRESYDTSGPSALPDTDPAAQRAMLDPAILNVSTSIGNVSCACWSFSGTWWDDVIMMWNGRSQIWWKEPILLSWTWRRQIQWPPDNTLAWRLVRYVLGKTMMRTSPNRILTLSYTMHLINISDRKFYALFHVHVRISSKT